MPAPTDDRPALFISWIAHHGRSEGISRALGIESAFIVGGAGNPALRYLRQWRQTRRLLAAKRPSTVIVMQPPAPALAAVLSSRAGRRARIVGDLHTGTFEDPKWRRALPWILRVLAKRGLAIVTNEPLALRARTAGTTAIVLHDLIDDAVVSDDSGFDDSTLAALDGTVFVLVPLAYANDEPLEAVLQAAAITPETTWVLTGRAPAEFSERAGANIRFTGYVSNGDYQRLLGRAAAVAALTTREFTMQRAGYEALSNAKPLVTTRMTTLQEYFGDAAVYADATGGSIAAAVTEALGDAGRLSGAMAELRTVKLVEQGEALARLRDYLDR